MTKYFIGVILSILILYGLMEAWPLIAGPTVFISSPENNQVFQDGIVEVKGKAGRASSVMLNGSVILRDQNGNFSSTLTFPRGGSILTFTVTDRFGSTVTETRSIFVP
jgi:hypothetical protein